MPRTLHAETVLGQSLFQKISNCRVLMVGAGGIGCELLKNLAMSGFRQIELVDLDTIDLSNLNRQFLFQKQHIMKSKAEVARESALKFNPNINIIAHHANIKSPHFNVEWFKSFDIVMNALDNLDARRHVNMMCLVADVPLIESGTEGYLGQVTVIKKDETECYDCQPKPVRRTYPVCTIRSTPSQPIHCIVWAKSYLFSQLFGLPEDDDDERLEAEMTQENVKEIENLKKETQALKQIREAMAWKIYQRVWSLAENFVVFLDSVRRLSEKLMTEQANNPNASLSFDKDDPDSLDFVTATSNLRSYIFGIEPKSQFKVKEMAGNIIPAIATTNAIIAGMIVMQSFKILNEKLNECKTTFLDGSRRPQIFLSESLNPPNPECRVCNNTHVILKVNTKKATLRDFLDKVIHGQDDDMDIGEVTVEEGGRIIYDVEYDDNLDVTFEQLQITDGKLVSVKPDDTDEQNSSIFAISHRDFETPDTWFQVDGKPFAARNKTSVAKSSDYNSNSSFDNNSSSIQKRKLEESEVDTFEGLSRKRPATDEEILVEDDDIMVTDNGTQKLIVID
ncbi:ubiquitin-activating enzyme E1 3 [Rhizophagus clarus]|uniref:Ubiquitin-activating enzyme E1-like n=1 Tax=Rhizophagus clarus TaxID=94130 RepID=A0A8H3LNU3_9GLOM|nr:ubiquitin-activating enzyme E1 3 [Rhizophagus clarus]